MANSGRHQGVTREPTPCEPSDAPPMEVEKTPTDATSSKQPIQWNLAVESTVNYSNDKFSSLHHEFLCRVFKAFPTTPFKVIPRIHADPITTLEVLQNSSATHLKAFPVKAMHYHQSSKITAICAVETSTSLYSIRTHPTIKPFLKEHKMRLRKHLWTNHLANITRPFFILGLNPKGLQSEDAIDYLPVDDDFKQQLRKFPIKIVPTKISQHDLQHNNTTQIFAIETLKSHTKDLYRFITTNLKHHTVFLPAHLRFTDLPAWNNNIHAHLTMLQYTTYLKISGPTPATMNTYRTELLALKGILGIYRRFDTNTTNAWNIAVVRSEFNNTKTLLESYVQAFNTDSVHPHQIHVHQPRSPPPPVTNNNNFPPLQFDTDTGTLIAIPNNSTKSVPLHSPKQHSYAQATRRLQPTTAEASELQQLRQENAALREQIELLKQQAQLSPQPTPSTSTTTKIKTLLQPAIQQLQQQAMKEFKQQFDSWFSLVTSQTNNILAQHKTQFDKWSDDAWVAITDLLHEHDQALEDFCLNKIDHIDIDYSDHRSRQPLSDSVQPHHESTSPILHLPENTNRSDNKRDIDDLSDLSSEKAAKHRAIVHFMEDDSDSNPSTTSSVTVDSHKTNNDKPPIKTGGYIPIHKRNGAKKQ